MARFQYDKTPFIDLLKRRGIEDNAVLDAMREVPREHFVSPDYAQSAYDDAPLPIEEGQTISQPYIVALMTQALQLKPGDSVLEIGTGSGYAAAVLSYVASRVYTVERHQSLVRQARERLEQGGYDNVQVLCGDGTLGWPEHAPFDGIVVTAGGPEPPSALVEQLAIGGRLVIPAGESQGEQRLLRLTRVSEDAVETEDLGGVRFVPLIGEQGWEGEGAQLRQPARKSPARKPVSTEGGLIADAAQPFDSVESADLSGLLDRIGDARVVLLGEASHGTAEFYEMRARITRELVLNKGFNFVAAEADWPDAAQIDRFIRGRQPEPMEQGTFSRFPTWMWANRQVLNLAQWLRDYNQGLSKAESHISFYGLDLYSLYSSIDSVIRYLEEVDEETAGIARQRYGCLAPWQRDPAGYGMTALKGRHEGCERQVVEMLNTLLQKRLEFNGQEDDRRFLDVLGNARLVKNAEEYYRVMYRGSVNTWNLRDQHMFDTLRHLLDFHGPQSKAVVWAHNSHLGDASATQMGERGEINVGYLCRQHFAEQAYAIGFGTHEGTVAAASDWGEPMEIKTVRPSHPDSYERLCHDAGIENFLLPLRHGPQSLVEALLKPRLERAIGVIYRPETERASHYFQAYLPRQFDEYIWFDQSRAVDALEAEAGQGTPETFPFGL